MKHLFFALFLTIVPLLPAHAESFPDDRLPDLVEKLSPAVVNISTTQKMQGRALVPEFQFPDVPPGSPLEEFRDFFEQFRQGMPEDGEGGANSREVFSLGSGFIIDPSGIVVTNNHVIAEAEEIKVIFHDGRKLSATVVGRDAKTDLAVLRITSDKALPFVEFGNSDKARVGQSVFAIGNPFGLGGTVTSGIISARARDINAGPFDDFLQTDAAINRGNSGGPLFDMGGKVIGINTAIFSPTGGSIGIGFAVPANEPIINQLKSGKKIQRGWLGVKIQSVTDEIAESLGLKEARGALVAEVSKGGPAEKAGIKPGDVIVAFNGKPVNEMRRLPRMVAETKIGSKVELSIIRKGGEKTLTLTLGELDESLDSAKDGKKPSPGKTDKKLPGKVFLGMTLETLTPELREQSPLPKEAKGVLITDIDRNSEAAARGLKRGDVIQQINEEEVATPDEVELRIQEAAKAGRKSALLRILRENDTIFVTVPTKEASAD
ncbi:MAG: DegQ family serine endoprotease [Alphaproteobacteria bacterium]|nr:DegQ family serine endoprotease [Alphaproteobacteria bacterium]